MCLGKWFHKVDPIVPITGDKVALLFGINNYPGSSNDLNGCLNDIADVEKKLNEVYPGQWTIKKFADSEVTKMNFRNTIKNQIVSMTSGQFLLIHYSGHGTRVQDKNHEEEDGYDEALYLYDGTFIDDEFNEVLQLIPEGVKVVIALDSCFSGTATRLINGSYRKSKYIPTQKIRSLKRRKKYLKSDSMKWVVFSGCQDDQTSADAFINNRYNGAFTFCWLKELNKGLNYKNWNFHTKALLSDYDFDQVSTLEGDEVLLNSIIFT
jgi:hypothetical protein